MGFLFQRPPSVISYYGAQIQSAVQALPIPIAYGAPRMPGNIVYVNGFNRVKQQSGGKGGKGLLSGGKGSNQYLYYATLIVALCEGPIGNIIVIYQDSNVWFNLQSIREVDPNSQTGKSGQPNFVPTDAQFFPGSDEQEPWSYIAGRWPSDARSYKDTCYIGLPNMQLDATAVPPQLNWVPRGTYSGTCPLNPATFNGQFTDNSGQHQESYSAGYVDADPALCILDFLTNNRYGAGFPLDLLDQAGNLLSTPASFDPSTGDNRLQTYCQAVGFGFSVVINNAEAAGSILDRWCKNLGVAIVWTGAILKFIPYWDQFSGANPGWGADNPLSLGKKYFAPDNQPLFVLSDDQLLQGHNPEEEPVTVDRVDPADVYNYVRVTFADRANQFNDNVAMDSDEVAIEQFGARVDAAQVGHEFSVMSYAQTSATVQLRRGIAVRRRVTFRLPPAWAFFDPMDINVITSGILVNFPIRIFSIEEDETGAITVVAEEFPAGAGSPTAFPGSPSTAPTILQTNVPVKSVNPPFIFEPTSAMLASQGIATPTIAVGASGSNGVADPNWGGASIYASLDNVTYQRLGQVSAPARQGILLSGLASYSGGNPDDTNTLSVSLVESGGELSSTTPDIAAQGVTLCAIMDADGCVELLSYTTVTLTGLNTYNLTGLYRGLFGTAPQSHSGGAQFLRIDSAVFEGPLPPSFIGNPLYVKLTSFNVYNQSEQDLSDTTVVTYVYTPIGQGTNVTTDPVVIDLLAGNPVDLTTSPTETLDLNTGGVCGGSTVIIDLGSL